MKIGYLQFKPEFGKVKDNIAKIENMVSDVIDGHASSAKLQRGVATAG